MPKASVVLVVCAFVLGIGFWFAAQINATDQFDARDVEGTWQIASYDATARPINGEQIPFTPLGLVDYEENVTGLQDGTVDDFAKTLCVPKGVLRAMSSPDPLEIVVTPDVVAVLAKDFYYLVRMNEEHYAEDLEYFPAFMGYHVGHWEGDALVIESQGFNPYTWLDGTGVPHGYELRTEQSIRRIDDQHLENVITIEDSEYFAMPWSVRLIYEQHPYVSMATGGLPCDDRGIASRYVHEREFGPPY